MTVRRDRYFLIGSYVFMPHPCGDRGYWFRTDRCVVFVPCSYCKAPKGTPCIGTISEATAGTHGARRTAYQKLPKKKRTQGRLIITIEEIGSVEDVT